MLCKTQALAVSLGSHICVQMNLLRSAAAASRRTHSNWSWLHTCIPPLTDQRAPRHATSGPQLTGHKKRKHEHQFKFNQTKSNRFKSHEIQSNSIKRKEIRPSHVPLMQADAQRHRWADEFSQQPDNQWASEFERTQTGAAASISGMDSQTTAAARGDTKTLADLLSSDANPKMKNSKFLQFISKMSRGEIILEDNEVGCLLMSCVIFCC